MRCRLCGRNARALPSLEYLPMRGPSCSSTPSVNAPATPCTTPEAIASWKPHSVTSQPPALQPQAASRIQTTEPRTVVSSRYAASRTRSISAPDMIEPVVQENSRNAAQKTPVDVVVEVRPHVVAPRGSTCRRPRGRTSRRPVACRSARWGRSRAPCSRRSTSRSSRTRCDDGDRQDVLERRRHHVLAARDAAS